MLAWIRSAAVQGHRALLVLTTAVLAIAASRIAAKPEALGDWMLLVGALLGLYIADACREVDEAVRNLPQTGHGLHERARRSVIDASAKYIPQALLLALAASVAGLLVTVLTTGGQSTVGK